MQHKQNSSRQMMMVVEEYMRSHDLTDMADVDIDDFAAWAWNNHRWSVPQIDPIRVIRRQAARALRDSFDLDPQERLVRRFHHFVAEDPETRDKIDHWVDIQTAPPEQMELSFAVRRRGIFDDVRQLKTDLDSYNQNNHFGASLQMDFNFNVDLQEQSFPVEYPTEPPDDGNGNE
jgi:hypothetical protein